MQPPAPPQTQIPMRYQSQQYVAPTAQGSHEIHHVPHHRIPGQTELEHDLTNVQHIVKENFHDVEVIPSQSYEIKETGSGYETFSLDNYNPTQPTYTQQYQAHPTQPAVQEEEAIPTIVLKIPGPKKYAEHLRTLLQQYLEVRAAQLYKELQEQEEQEIQKQKLEQQKLEEERRMKIEHERRQKMEEERRQKMEQERQQKLEQERQKKMEEERQIKLEQERLQKMKQQQEAQKYYQQQQIALAQQQQQLVQQQQQQQQQHILQQQQQQLVQHHAQHQNQVPQQQHHQEVQYVQYVPATGHEQYYIQQGAPGAQYIYQQPEQEAPVAMAQHQSQEQAQQQPQYQYQTIHLDENQQPFIYQYQQQEEQTQEVQYVPQQQSQPTYEKPVVQYVTPTPDQEPRQIHEQYFTMYQQQQQQQHEEEGEIQEPKISENYPGDKHTRVIYRKKPVQMQPESDVENAHYSYPAEHSYAYEERAHVEAVPEQQVEQQVPQIDEQPMADAKEDVVAITQKPKELFNYHPHHPTYALRIRGGTKASKRESPISEEEVKKIVKMVKRLRKKNHKNTTENSNNTENRSREAEQQVQQNE